MALTRYIVLNPVRAGTVKHADDWPWSSHHFLFGREPAPPWLDTEWILGQFDRNQETALVAYANFIIEGAGSDSPLKATRHQLVLGDDEFLLSLQPFVDARVGRDTPKAQRRAAVLTLAQYQSSTPTTGDAMAAAYRSTAYTMEQIADHFGVSTRTVSRAIRRREK